MAQFFVMPQASPTMTVGVVARWVAPEGAELRPQSVIAQVETDKATMDIEVFDKAVMLKHLVAEGAEVPAGAPIAILGAAGDDVSALLAEYVASKSNTGAPAAAAPIEPASSAPAAAPAPVAPPPSPPGGPPAAAPEAGTVPAPSWMGKTLDESVMEPRGRYRVAGRRIVASPLARAIAASSGVELSRVGGSGPGGRIVAADVEKAAATPTVAPSADSGRADQPVRVTQMRKTIAKRLTEVHQAVPVFYLTVNFDAAGLVALKELAGGRGQKITYNDLIIKAVAQALRDVPEVNAAWMGDTILRRGSVDIGVAVALPEGLITPILRNADQKRVGEINTEIRALAARAKEGKLDPSEYTGGSFTISNLGMLDIEHFTAILNPPEAAILALGAVLQVPVVVGGAVVPGWRMKATLTCDHRVVDGALGARFLQALRSYIEAPALLVL